VINDYWDRREFPWALVPKLAGLGVVGVDDRGLRLPGLSPLAAGMATLEMSRGDGSVNTFLGVQSGLAMGSINMLGSEEQKQRWLPAMATLDKIGAFALTEPNHGVGLRRAGDHRAARRRRARPQRGQALDRQREHRRRRGGVGARRRRRGSRPSSSRRARTARTPTAIPPR
jgi:alkylation response protein AidB-like acyl-CoA dehydrogenase